jgi:hypothetical protein
VIYHEDGSVEYKFSSRYTCTKRETSARDISKITKARRGQISQQGTSDDEASDDNIEYAVDITDNTTYTFLDHDPVVLARLPANIRRPYNSVQTTNKGTSARFLNFIVSLAARKMSFSTIRSLCVERQKSALSSRLRDAAAVASNSHAQANLHHVKLNGLESLTFSDLIPSSFPPRNYLQKNVY